jgi:ATP-dependent DNA ligase
MKGYIDGYNFAELDVMKYYAPPASWSDEKKKAETRNRIFSGDWYGARKVDGALYVFLKDEDGNITLRGRSKSVNGEYLDKWDHLPQLEDWASEIPNGSCLLGEVYRPGDEGSKVTTTIMGCLTDKAIERQKEESQKMHYYVFDVLAWDGESFLKKKAIDRFDFLITLWRAYPSKYVEYAEYVNGSALWDTLQELLLDGFEGMVITKGDSYYEPGKRPSKTTLKVKQELKETIDCVVIGANPPTREYNGKSIQTWKYWVHALSGDKLDIREWFNDYEKGAPYLPVTKNFYYGMAGSLKLGLYKDGQMIYFGDLSGLTEEILTNWEALIGRVVEVGGMQIDEESHHIRHPRMIGWRDDKKPTDCTWEQVEKM